MSLDLAVSRAVMRARLLETALHSSGTWTITVGGVTVPANRHVLDDRIVFSAMFTEIPDGDLQLLSCDGQELALRPFRHPPFTPFVMEWSIVVREQDSVGV